MQDSVQSTGGSSRLSYAGNGDGYGGDIGGSSLRMQDSVQSTDGFEDEDDGVTDGRRPNSSRYRPPAVMGVHSECDAGGSIRPHPPMQDEEAHGCSSAKALTSWPRTSMNGGSTSGGSPSARRRLLGNSLSGMPPNRGISGPLQPGPPPGGMGYAKQEAGEGGTHADEVPVLALRLSTPGQIQQRT